MTGGTETHMLEHTTVEPAASIEAPAAPRPRPAPHLQASPDVHLYRIDRVNRILHIALMTSFLGLAATGLPLLFSGERWAAVLARLVGGFAAAGTVHRVCAVVLLATFLTHVSRLAYRLFVNKEVGILWGPDSMVPQPRDVTQLAQHFRWFVGLGRRPIFDHFTYWEKFDYWAVFWGVGIIGGSGLLLWFPVFFARFVPGWLFNIAMLIHGEEALLAVGFIFTIHFFNGHLRPEKFPMDTVIFTGRVTEAEIAHERPAEFERLRTGQVRLAPAPPPPAWLPIAGGALGTIAVTTGLVLFVLILYALLSHL
jgi:cytochrome b subunit of formate dehydrogenase